MGLLEELASVILASKRVPELPSMSSAADSDSIMVYSATNSRVERILVSAFRSQQVSFNTTYFGAVTTAGDTTTETEVQDFINSIGFSIGSTVIKVLECTIYIGGVAYRRTWVYRPNVAGSYGDTAANPIDYSDLQIINTQAEADSEESQVIDLGDIGSDDPWTYINALADGTVYELDAGTVYQFTAVKDAVDVDYLYVGVLPNIIGDGGNVVTSADFYQLVAAGTVAAADVTFNPSGLDVLTATDMQALGAEIDSALLDARTTGIRYGGDISDLGAGVIRIAAGAGAILDNTTPSAPTYSAVTWAQTDIDLSALDDVYFIKVNSAGTVSASVLEPSHSEYREAIWLHRVSIRSGVVSGWSPIVMPTQQLSGQIWDIWRALGFLKDGLVIEAASTDLSIKHSAGDIYLAGANFYTDPTNPHELELALNNPITFRHVLQDGTQGSDVTQLDVANYDNAGVITAIGGGSTACTIFTLMLFPSSANYRFFYGQTVYANVDAAFDALREGTYTPTLPASYDNAVTLGWVIAEKNATDLSDGTQILITSNKFGLVGGSIATSGVGNLLAVNNLSDVDNTDTARDNLNAEKKLPVVASASIATTYTVDHANGFWQLLTMTGATTFSDSNLAVDGRARGMYLTGNFAPTFPAYWTPDADSDTYDGTVLCRITWDVLDATVSSEDVRYMIKIIE